ncbi:MAG: type II secretion system protein GspE [Coxiella sp. (in: Bacteria)]|nr:MAG: type II secretion system protein GspE [Coxiella sp. (in: g-proteobacteria)]
MSEHLAFGFAKQHGVILSRQDDDYYYVTHRPGLDAHTIIELRRLCHKPLRFTQVGSQKFESILTQHYENSGSALEAMSGLEDNIDLNTLMQTMPKTKDLLESDDDAPIIKLINALFTQALKQAASDIHFETFEEKLIVRFRVDGILHEILEPPRVLAPLITSRIKVMAKLDIAEKRLPQDGRISIRIAGRAVDVRVSTIPTHYGERIVLRLLDKQSAPLDLKKLGMSATDYEKMSHLISSSHGIILVTGPTGSGKTTTLYAVLTELNDSRRNILTVEDPIEYYLPGIGQTQVNTKVDMTFARGLRAILRQDPDIVMVGEIRDYETVEMSIQASLTGHLVLSTLHTNSAIGAVTRLRDMGTEPFLLSSTIIGVLAQRLVRVLCADCKEGKPASAKECDLMALTDDQNPILYHANGCDLCAHTGYIGRTGIYEIIEIDETLRTQIHDNASETQMLDHARKTTPSMRTDGWRKVIDGQTTVEEVLRVS